MHKYLKCLLRRGGQIGHVKIDRSDGWLWRIGTMHLVYWLIDLIEGLVPLIKIGMEG